MMFADMWARLHVGPDIAPDTDYLNVDECFIPGHTPEYSLEIQKNGEWSLYCFVVPDELPEVVELMHWNFDTPVRLMEDGWPVFGCYWA